jgi:hypothetical protein
MIRVLAAAVIVGALTTATAASAPIRDVKSSCRVVGLLQFSRLTKHPHFTSTIAYVVKDHVTYCISLGELSIGGGHWIDEVSASGATISLEDGSLWLISPLDRIDTDLWLPVDDITVTHSRDPSYPYRLVNTDEGETATARFLSSN